MMRGKVSDMKKSIWKAVFVLLCLLLGVCATGCSAKEYSVVFNLNGGQLVSGQAEQTVEEGQAAVAPIVTNDGKELSWDKDFSNITSNTIVNAVWTAKMHTVTFDPGIEGMESVKVNVEEGAAAAAPSFEREGMLLSGWSGDFSNVTEDITVTAVWERKRMDGTEISAYADSRVVTIHVHDNYGNDASGSGFFIDGKGTLVTNYHVIEFADSIRVELNDGGIYTVAKVVNFSEKYDLAVLTVDGVTDNDYFELCTEVIKGEQVYAIGSALGELTGTFTSGVVSNTNRTVGVISCIQMDAAISHGNSGGPLVNQYGEVVGINSFSITSGSELNLAIKADMLYKLPEKRDFSVNDYVEWWRTEIDRSYRPTDGKYYKYSIVNTYQQVTGCMCSFSSDDLELEESVSGYEPAHNYYFYEYDSGEYDSYVAYLKELGFEYSPEKSNVKNNGQMSVYYNAASELTVITLILSDKALLVAVTY